MKRIVQGIVLVRRDHMWHTEDGRYTVSEDRTAMGFCENPHPMGRGKPQCPGGINHPITLWNVWDNTTDDHAFGDVYDSFREAMRELAQHLEESRYHRQREQARTHPNRKDRLKPYHDTGRPYAEVATQIESAIGQFKAATPQNSEVGHQVRELHQATGQRICIDADCPGCGWPERWFDGDVFGCRKCTYTSTLRDA